jgi:hypothetical protein
LFAPIDFLLGLWAKGIPGENYKYSGFLYSHLSVLVDIVSDKDFYSTVRSRFDFLHLFGIYAHLLTSRHFNMIGWNITLKQMVKECVVIDKKLC